MGILVPTGTDDFVLLRVGILVVRDAKIAEEKGDAETRRKIVRKKYVARGSSNSWLSGSLFRLSCSFLTTW